MSAASVNRLPLAGGAQTGRSSSKAIDAQAAGPGNVDYRIGHAGLFPDDARFRCVAGRAFTDAIDDAAPLVAIIDESAGEACLATPIPSGRRVRIPVAGPPWLTIVGVVGHIRHDRLDEDMRPQIYFTFEQRTQDRMALVVRTQTDPAAIGAAARRRRFASVDPEQPVYDARTLAAVVARSLGQRWLQTALLGTFALIAVLLASIGVYGVIAYAVGQRRREFGIRLALGARRGEIVTLVLRHGAMLFAIGAAIGLAAAAASARALGSLLFHVAAFDAASFGLATAILFVVALAACGIPARRAAGVDPSVALRTE